MKLILDIKQASDLQVLVPLLERLGISFTQEGDRGPDIKNKLPSIEDAPMSREEAYEVIKQGCEMTSFGDPIEFQNTQRKDRQLPFRND